MMFWFFLKSAALLCLTYFFYHTYQFLVKVYKYWDMPGKTFFSFFWVLFTKKDEHPIFGTETQEENGKKYGKIYKVITGSEAIICLNDADLVKQVFLTNFKNFGKSPFLKSFKKLRKGDQNTLFELDPDDEWKRYRSLLSPAFSDNELKLSFENTFDKVTNDLVNHWTKLIGKEANVSEDVGNLTLDVIGSAGFGKEFKTLENGDMKYAKIINFIFKTITTSVMVPKFILNLPIPYLKDIMQNNTVWNNYLSSIVDERKEQIKEHEKKGEELDKHDLLTRMMKEASTENGSLNDNELIAHTGLFLAAGHETTANTLSWSCYYLSKNREYQEKIFKESLNYSGKFDEYLTGYPYLKAFVHEVLRLRNPAHIVGRYCLKDTKIGNYMIYKGDQVIAMLRGIHRNEEVFGKDALEFRPERFLEEEKERHQYIPFSFGPRTCIGKRFAELEIYVSLVKIVKNFILLPVEQNVQEEIAFTLRPSVGIKVKITKRE